MSCAYDFMQYFCWLHCVLVSSEQQNQLQDDLLGVATTGTLPPGLMMVQLAILGLSHNSLTGTIPSTPCQVFSLRLAGNQLQGSLPASMGTWTSLELDFSYNRYAVCTPNLGSDFMQLRHTS
jgi:hypothetical protein